jgi:hypothetical protein
MHETVLRLCQQVSELSLFNSEHLLTVRSSKRDKIWSSMTAEEREDYLATTKDKGNKRLDFRFAS